MLSNLFEVEKGIFQSSTYRSHPTQSRTLELLALEERLCILEQSYIVPRYGFDQVLRGRQLAKGYTEVIGVVQCVKKVLIWKS